jgi:hypothetical protein
MHLAKPVEKVKKDWIIKNIWVYLIGWEGCF